MRCRTPGGMFRSGLAIDWEGHAFEAGSRRLHHRHGDPSFRGSFGKSRAGSRVGLVRYTAAAADGDQRRH
jgi:hypothetical protein